MILDLTAALVVFLAVAAFRFARHRKVRSAEPLPDVPDASPGAMPISAPGLTLPYSSLDPSAPANRLQDRSGTERLPKTG